VQKLYLPPGCKYYGCQYCYNVGYSSQCEDEQIRARTNAEKIRLRLGGSPSLGEPFPDKPKRMWRRTYGRLRARAEETEMRSKVLLSAMMERFRQSSRISQ